MNVGLELARRGDSSGLMRAQDEIEKLEALIAQILTLTRIDLRKEQKLDQPVELRPLLESIVHDANFEGSARRKTVSVSSAADCRVFGDAALLRSCIENVVRNALRYAPENSMVEVSLRTLRSVTNSSAQISVRDHGPGVPPETLQKLFEPFFRVSESRDRDSGGSGLGLAIAQRVATMHSGNIQVQNASDGGLAVTITLSMERALAPRLPLIK
jgi:two-component system sensor histidine kinase CpxA